jgi:putative ABC transport system substrate-binding protein
VKYFPVRLVPCATLLVLLAAPLLVYSRSTELEMQTNAAVASNFLEPAEVAELTRVIDRIEHSSDVVVFRLQLAANDSVFAQATRNDSVKTVLGAEPGNIAVLYPNLGEPYRDIFAKIIDGVEAQIGRHVVSYAVGGAMTEQDILASLKRQDIKVVIALGRQGLKAASGLVRDYGVVVGGVVSAPEDDARNYSVISLAPDPGMLFERLKYFMPNARRVVVVYDPRQNAWLIRLARQAARKQGLELQAVEVTDLKSAVRAYQDLLASVDPKKDALWLPQDPTTVEETSVLPLVLEGAWNLNLAVFSSNVTHVKRGALFSLYPNNVALGRQLAASALNYPVGIPSVPTVVPMKDALLAVNLRTASHLGMQLSSPVKQGIDLVFPAQ